jgi:molybdopterin converting factor small subunit
MAHVIIPFPLRKHTDGQRELRIAGATLADVVEGLLREYPGLQIINDQPALLSLFVNGSLAATADQDLAGIPVSEDDEISLIIPIAGG